MSQYCTIAQLKMLGSMPAEDIDALETLYPGVVAANLVSVSGQMDARLSKRYAAPFVDPFPQALVSICARLTAYRLWMKRGFNPNGAMDQAIQQDAKDADEWLKEAANSKDGLIDLPVRQDSTASSAVSVGGPLGYSETSPYVWMDRQRENAEDWQ